MSKFGCIYFDNDNIILSKASLEKTKLRQVFLEPISYLDIKGYNIYVMCNPEELNERNIRKLEEELLNKNIYYVACRIPTLQFEQIEVVKGESIKMLLSPYILDYIFKYKLISTNPIYAKVGVIGGRINNTLDVMMPIIDKVTELVIFTDEPSIYREMIHEIYQKTRIRIKIMYPNAKIIGEMDVLFDVNEKTSYTNWANVHAIYIDFFRNIRMKKIKKQPLPPSIWHDFDIICEKHPIDKCVLEAALGADGLTRSILRKQIKKFDIKISRVYKISKS